MAFPCGFGLCKGGTLFAGCTQTGIGNANILDYQYNFGLGVADNGNVNKITNRITPGRSVTYSYDELNRIKEALTDGTSGSTCWGQLFGTMNGSTFVSGYDIWGNLNTISADPARVQCECALSIREH